MSMHPITRKVKAALIAVPDIWVRGWRDGTAWVGTNRRYAPAVEVALDTVNHLLTTKGFKCKPMNVPGTTFKNCIEVTE